MEEIRQDAGPSGQGGRSNAAWWPPEFVDKFGSVSLGSQGQNSNSKESPRNLEQDVKSSNRASHILWSTGTLSEPIPNGFYFIVPDKSLKQLFSTVPTLDKLHALGDEGLHPDVILVDFQKDKKLFMLKQLIITLVRGLKSNPATVVKKIAGLVAEVYKRSSLQSPVKGVHGESTESSEGHGIQLLGQIKHGSCRPRAILFKVLADTVGLESRLVVGSPGDGAVECVDPCKHMSVMVGLKSAEMLVDLERFPGQLIPLSTKAFAMAHVSPAAGESDSAENDSCDSPLEPNSPMQFDHESSDKLENLLIRRRLEGSPSISGPSSRNLTLRPALALERRLSFSQSEPSIATEFWRHNRRNVIAEQKTASSSPEHQSSRTRTKSILSGDRNSVQDFNDDTATSSCKSAGTPKSESKRIKRRSISITPEIGDDIVRAVRAMGEALKQKRLLQEQGDDASHPYSSDDRTGSPDLQKNESGFHLDAHDQVSGGRSTLYSHSREPLDPQKAVSLPSSPQNYRSQSSERSTPPPKDIRSIWNQVLESPMFQNKPLLAYEEWSIDFSELTVGTRVGIGFFGEVFRGMWNGTDVAIKVFLEQDFTAENLEDFCNEISLLSRLRHPNVILFLGACTKPPRLSLVTEYMEMGSLYHLIHMSGQKKKLVWSRKLKMLRDICRGLMCIHRMKIVHRDLKSANCLVNKHWVVKICDFGLSRIMTDATMADAVPAGTPEWMAPELIRNEPFSEKCDIFSLGVIMWELCTLSRPWEGIPPQRVVYAVANAGSRLEIPDGPLGSLIADCWAEPDQRPSCEEILSRLLDCEYSIC